MIIFIGYIQVHNSKEITTPFDDLIIQLSTDIFGLGETERKIRYKEIEQKSFLINQLGFLRVSYIYLVEINLYARKCFEGEKKSTTRDISIEEYSLSWHKQKIYEVVILYNNFISVLNQFDRVLPHYFPNAKIPNGTRINFYRNKVIEHWDDYTKSIGSEGFVYVGNKPPIPVIERVYYYRERQKLMQDLKNAFLQLNVLFNWDKDVYNMVSSKAEYCESIYKAIEETGKMRCKKGTNKDFDALILLLLKLGFPVPIIDMELYSKDFTKYLKTLFE